MPPALHCQVINAHYIYNMYIIQTGTCRACVCPAVAQVGLDVMDVRYDSDMTHAVTQIIRYVIYFVGMSLEL